MCVLMKYDRKPTQDILKNETIRFFLTQDHIYLEILEFYINLNYRDLMNRLKIIIGQYEQDYIFKRYKFDDIIVDKVVKLYLLPYNKISVKKVIY